MENIFVEFLPPWIETGLQPAFYDKESGTVLQQTARMYARVNMLIRMFNKLSKNTKTTVEDYINQFNELHDYVHDYFDNLDVQEEINNKLDDMAEDGTLQAIIYNYLTTQGVLAYNTVTDLASDTYLVVGSHVKTYGYKRKGDGVYNLYTVREAEENETGDGYNTVLLASGLIAEKLQSGKEIVVELLSTDNLQDYLSLTDKKTIILPANTTYTVTSRLFINSDTTLDLNNSTLYCNYDSETLVFLYGLTDTFTEYNGYKNITIRNGKIEKACICMMHNKNVTIENVEFIRTNSRHSMQIAGSYNVTVTKCVFNGTTPANETGSECVNIDPCNYGGQPYMEETSVMYDHTPNMFITVSDNEFRTPVDNGMRYTNAIGSHGADDNHQTIAKNVLIENNKLGSPYSHTINICGYINVTINNNEVLYDTNNIYSGDVIRFVYLRDGFVTMNITNNNIVNAQLLISAQENTYDKKNLTITNNTFKGIGDGDRGVIWMRNTVNVNISDNFIKTDVAGIFMDCNRNNGTPIEGTETHDVIIHNNTIESTTNNGSGLIKVRGNSYNVDITDNILYKFDNNSFGFTYGGTFSGDPSKIRVVGNSCNFETHFTRDALVSKSMYNNNCLVDLSGQISEPSTTITLNLPATNFKSLIVMVGGASENYQRLEICPYHPNGDYIETTDRVWKQVVTNASNQVGVATISTSDSATKLTYSGNTNIRKVYGVI